MIGFNRGSTLMKSIFSLFVKLSLAFLIFVTYEVEAADFPVGELERRVDFWVQIFTRYGRDDLVVHHRHYPQVILAIVKVDESSESEKRAVDLVKVRLGQVLRGQISDGINKKIFDAVKRGFRDPKDAIRKMLDLDLVRGQRGIKQRYKRAIELSELYLPQIEKIFREYGLPVELTRLPFIESSFDYRAYSAVGAAGIWQFMPVTARSYMQVGKIVDERLDPLKASHGAAKYLRSAYRRLGSWPLAITSYNHGVQGILNKVNEIGSRDIVKLIQSQKLGFASQNFYPEFLAALEVYRNRKSYFPDYLPQKSLPYREHRLENHNYVSGLVRYFGVSEEVLRELNPQLTPKVWRNYYRIPKGFILKVPVDKKASSFRNIDVAKATTTKLGKERELKVAKASAVTLKASPPKFKYYRVKRGDTFWTIAKSNGTTIKVLKEANNLKGVLKAGQKLKIPLGVVAGNTVGYITPTYHVVKRGEFLLGIAKKYRISLKSLKSLNPKVNPNRIRPGLKLRVR